MVPSPAELRVPERVCLALDAAGRRVLPVVAPDDLDAEATFDAAFEHELRRGRRFAEDFAVPLELEGRTVLEVGAGWGGMLPALAERGAARVIGVELDRDRAAYARRRLADRPEIEVLEEDIERCSLPSASVDVIVSDAVFEHIHDIRAALSAMAGLLRPGGLLFARFAPLWLSYNGPHLIKHIAVPWVHLLFSERTIVNVLRHQVEAGRLARSSVEARIADLEQMGRLTRRRYARAARESGLEVLQEDSRSPRRVKAMAERLPLLDELLAGTLVSVLRKPI